MEDNMDGRDNYGHYTLKRERLRMSLSRQGTWKVMELV